jgi:RsiW-degrading membrane proteinase PrsW (M82 family)
MIQQEASIPIHKPNIREMIFFFSCGVIMSVPITLFIVQLANPLIMGLDRFSAALVSTAFLAPLIEEFSKTFPLFYRHGETQRSIFKLALLVGLGFGLLEFFTYVFVLEAYWPVRLFGLVFHPASTSISAYGIATKRPLPFFAIAVALHFTNNFLALVNPFPVNFSIIIVTLTGLASWRLYARTREKIII